MLSREYIKMFFFIYTGRKCLKIKLIALAVSAMTMSGAWAHGYLIEGHGRVPAVNRAHESDVPARTGYQASFMVKICARVTKLRFASSGIMQKLSLLPPRLLLLKSLPIKTAGAAA
ncbi:hypothetical protein [Pantoea alhagi]|uniref:hypothetical protein n=1 Tax=Pantoea alhagi TaxID=1891675 RepID=UPI0012F48DB0|nr:hypothetical protein [Pantoea alhagi]